MRLNNAVLLLAGLALLALPLVAAAATLNEIRIDQTSTDNDEYFELAGDPGESLDGLTLIVIGDGATGSGTIEAVVDLTGYAIQADGVFAMGEATFTGTCGSIDAVGDLNFENSDNVTFFLLDGFTGALADDLDTDDDGTLDATPWTTLVDGVSLVETLDSGDMYYADAIVGPDDTFVPGHVAFCGGIWHILDFDLCTATETPGEPSDDMCGSVPTDTQNWGGLKALYR